MDNLMDKIVALAKRRGFIYPGSEIYGGLTGTWDYGPLGVELKRNIKNEWWRSMVQLRSDVVGLDAAIIMNPEVWRASGHLEAFTDPLVECKNCHFRFRQDKLPPVPEANFVEPENNPWWISMWVDAYRTVHGMEDSKDLSKAIKALEVSKQEQKLVCPSCNKPVEFTVPKKFNLLVEAKLGVVEGEKQTVYLRGEITQGAFVNFGNVVSSTRVKIPFGIAQIGKAFRNEITPGNFTFRSREFEQMELEFFVRPEDAEGDKWFEYWKNQRMDWYLSLGMSKDKLRFRRHEEDEKAHYAKYAEDIEFESPFGWSEFEGIHHRGDWDLGRHKLQYIDDDGSKFTPWTIETSGGVDRSTLFFLLNAYREDEKRVWLSLHPKLAPYKAAVFPLLANKPELVEKAKGIYDSLKKEFMVAWDDRGNIGKRYLSQDEAGTPFCITVDFDSLTDDSVTVRDRDTAQQERVKISELQSYIYKKLE